MVKCPHCGAPATQRIAPYGTGLLVAQWECLACRTIFEVVRKPKREQDVKT